VDGETPDHRRRSRNATATSWTGRRSDSATLSVMPIAVPGHTPGSMALIFPVTDNGQRHTAALFGGAWLTPGILSDQALQTFLQSAQRFKAATERANSNTFSSGSM